MLSLRLQLMVDDVYETAATSFPEEAHHPVRHAIVPMCRAATIFDAEENALHKSREVYDQHRHTLVEMPEIG
jgi:hypothetical protein